MNNFPLHISPTSPQVTLIGRFDKTIPEALGFIWQASEVRFIFTGTRLKLFWKKTWGRNFFDLVIDGEARLLRLEEASGAQEFIAENLGNKTHTVSLYKRSEAIFGHAFFAGFALEKDAVVLAPPAAKPLIEFYGDSITAGACNQDGEMDQYDDLSTHNQYLAYGAQTARLLGMDQRSIAVSGTGLTASWNPVYMNEVYHKVYPDKDSQDYDYADPAPQMVVVNLGQNDFGFPESLGFPPSENFPIRYVEFVRALRKAYPQALVACVLGGMSAAHDSQFLALFNKAVDELKNDDKNLVSLVFQAWSSLHPRVEVHTQLAQELAALLKPFA